MDVSGDHNVGPIDNEGQTAIDQANGSARSPNDRSIPPSSSRNDGAFVNSMVAQNGVSRYNARMNNAPMKKNIIPLLTACLFLAGCGGGPSGTPTGKTSTGRTPRAEDAKSARPVSQSDVPSPRAAAAAAPSSVVSGDSQQSGETKSGGAIALTVGSWDDLLKMAAARTGQVVVVDIWSTDCAPCIREFPHFVALQKKYPRRVACISFNTDYYGDKRHPPESLRPSVSKFLASQGATFQNVLCNEESETLYDRLHLGGPPAVYVFDRAGRLAKRFDNDGRKPGQEFSYSGDVEPFIKTLLAR